MPPASPEPWRAGGFGIYVHWPFCAARCPYCDFNSHVRGHIDQARWIRALTAEIEAIARRVPERVVGSVFFGGGTPSLMEPDTVAAVLTAVDRAWMVAPDAEITLEANPTSVEAGRFAGYRGAGVNRISIGIQALDDTDLRRLGRLHTVREALAAFDIARDTFDRVSFDLIYARQDQSVAAWQSELRMALDLSVDHLSLYQLTIEPGTAFGDRAAAGRLAGLPDPDKSADLYATTQDLCAEAGLAAYEISNHARPGAEGRHNLVYWRCGDYVGIGPGAHGRLTAGGARWATTTEPQPERWLSDIEAHGSATTFSARIPPRAQGREIVLMGLRLGEGVDLDRVGSTDPGTIDAERLRSLIADGLVEVHDHRLRATTAGRPVLGAILGELI